MAWRIPGTNWHFDPTNTLPANAVKTFVGANFTPYRSPGAPLPSGARMKTATVYKPPSQPRAQVTRPSSTGQTGYGGYSGYSSAARSSYVDTAAIQAQEDAARAAELRPEIAKLIKSAKSVYDSLYSDVDTVAADKTKQIGTRYQQDVDSLTGQFNEQFPLIGAAYAGRGTYDSSYRMNKEKGAEDAYKGSANKLALGRDDDLSEIGRYVAEQRAKFNAQEGDLDAINKQIEDSENPDELLKVRNQLDEKIRTLKASRAGLQNREAYMSTLNKRVPEGQRIIGLKQSLGNVLASAVPGPIKRQVGTQLIQNSGLNGAAQAAALEEFYGQVDEEERLPVPGVA